MLSPDAPKQRLLARILPVDYDDDDDEDHDDDDDYDARDDYGKSCIHLAAMKYSSKSGSLSPPTASYVSRLSSDGHDKRPLAPHPLRLSIVNLLSLSTE